MDKNRSFSVFTCENTDDGGERSIMLDDFRKKIKKHPKLYNLLFMVFIFGSRQIRFLYGYFLRAAGIKGKQDYSAIKAFKGIHMGKRCFIVGTGPSLTMEDLQLIKNEYSFSVNSIVLSFEDTDWRPDYYAIQDKFAYIRLSDAIKHAGMPYIFNGISDKLMTPVMDIDYIPFPLNLLDHGKMIPNHITKFSPDAYKVVYSGHSITYSVIQLAVYMGFKEIILLGVDCDYSKPVNHIKAYSQQNDRNAAYLMRESFKVAKKYADKHGIKILNATRNATLDVFEKVELEKLNEKV